MPFLKKSWKSTSVTQETKSSPDLLKKQPSCFREFTSKTEARLNKERMKKDQPFRLQWDNWKPLFVWARHWPRWNCKPKWPRKKSRKPITCSRFQPWKRSKVGSSDWKFLQTWLLMSKRFRSWSRNVCPSVIRQRLMTWCKDWCQSTASRWFHTQFITWLRTESWEKLVETRHSWDKNENWWLLYIFCCFF